MLNIDWKPLEKCDFKLEYHPNRAYLFSSLSRTVLLIKLFIVWRNDFVAVYFGLLGSTQNRDCSNRDDLIELSQLWFVGFILSFRVINWRHRDKLFMWDFDWQLTVRIFSFRRTLRLLLVRDLLLLSRAFLAFSAIHNLVYFGKILWRRLHFEWALISRSLWLAIWQPWRVHENSIFLSCQK